MSKNSTNPLNAADSIRESHRQRQLISQQSNAASSQNQPPQSPNQVNAPDQSTSGTTSTHTASVSQQSQKRNNNNKSVNGWQRLTRLPIKLFGSKKPSEDPRNGTQFLTKQLKEGENPGERGAKTPAKKTSRDPIKNTK